MGYITRADLRRMAATKLGQFGEGSPTTVTGTTLLDVNTPERKRENDDYWNGGTLYVASGTGGPANELIDESAVTKTQTSGAVVTTTSVVDPYDAACIKIDTSATVGSVGVATYPLGVTAARTVEVSFFCKGNGAVCGRWGFRASTGATTDVVGAWSTKTGEPTYVTGERWTRLVRRLTVPASATICSLDLYSPLELSKTVWFDKPSARMLGQERYISDWVNSTSTFTVATWTTNPGVGSQYEAYYKTFSFTDFNRALNDALRAGFPYIFEIAEDTSLATLSATYAYDIPDNIDPANIVEVAVQADTGTATAPYSRHIFWNIRHQGQTAQLQFHTALATGRTVRLTYVRPLQPLMSDFDTVDERWVPYLVARTRAELYASQLGKTSRTDRAQVGENRDAFFEEASFALGQVRMQWPATHVKPQYPGFH